MTELQIVEVRDTHTIASGTHRRDRKFQYGTFGYFLVDRRACASQPAGSDRECIALVLASIALFQL